MIAPADPIQEAHSLMDQLEQACFSFQPRPDQHDRFDQQTSFVNSKSEGVIFMIGGNGAGTSECTMHKIANLVLRDQPPPRKDTPFWIISGTYEQCMNTCWKEKLYGHGHIPKCEIEWDRIDWYSSKEDMPYSVPLKPWPHRPWKNWTLKFKSYEQGRAQMQGESIGGFAFIEQFPYSLLTEVLRGCREYNFPGSKLCEFTPVDPALSAPIEDLIDNGLPPGWEIWRANTECAKEAGHISEAWFDEFFGMIPEEMLLTRMIGAFASYEGTIYQGFNPRVHLVGDNVVDFPQGVYYRRGLDWGSGPDNPLACLWGYRNGLGEWFIYDEYYSSDQNMTVMDHLDKIREKHEWPTGSPMYGTTWSDPSSPDCIRIAQRCGFSISSARNAVYEGIDYVRYLLQKCPSTNRPKLFIHKDNCPNLIRQLKTYRWLRGVESGNNPRDARPSPLKKDDHAVDALRYLLFSESQHDKAHAASMKRDYNIRRHGIQLSGRNRYQ